MALLLFAIGAALLIIGSIRIRDFEAEGPTVRAAGLVLTMPLVITLFLGFMLTMFFDDKGTSQIISFTEIFITIASLTVAYALLFRDADALKSLMPQDSEVIKRTATRKPRDTFPRIMTITQAAIYLGITENELIKLINQGKIPASKLTTGYRIARAVLDDYLDEGSEPETE